MIVHYKKEWARFWPKEDPDSILQDVGKSYLPDIRNNAFARSGP
jgi:hypothetical protein